MKEIKVGNFLIYLGDNYRIVDIKPTLRGFRSEFDGEVLSVRNSAGELKLNINTKEIKLNIYANDKIHSDAIQLLTYAINALNFLETLGNVGVMISLPDILEPVDDYIYDSYDDIKALIHVDKQQIIQTLLKVAETIEEDYFNYNPDSIGDETITGEVFIENLSVERKNITIEFKPKKTVVLLNDVDVIVDNHNINLELYPFENYTISFTPLMFSRGELIINVYVDGELVDSKTILPW